jgi:hypothetical protein
MKAQVANNMMSSFLAFLDNRVLSKGDAYTNHSSLLYKVDQSIHGSYTIWGAPFKQMVCDASIASATKFDRVHINGAGPYQANTSGISFFQHHNGQVFFDESTAPAGITSVSGSYAIKDFNTYLTSEPEEELLFTTKFELRPKTTQAITGLSMESKTYPAIFIKDNGGRNEPFAFGGLDNTIMDVRAIVLADSAFNLDAVCSIMKDCNTAKIALMEHADFPFNAYGACTGTYNYETLAASKTDSFFVESVSISKTVPNRGDYDNINPDVFSAFADFELSNVRTT